MFNERRSYVFVYESIVSRKRNMQILGYPIRSLSQHMLVLNTRRAALDLMEKRGALYADRVRYTMLHELVRRQPVPFAESAD